MTTRSASVALLLALGIAVAGCTAPAPAPSPTPTGFADDAAAFAAAEATYRAYVDALNRVDLSDPATFEDVYAWTTGDALAEERKNLSQMHADAWHVSGSSSFDRFTGLETSSGIDNHVLASTCLDVTAVSVTDASGRSVVPSDRVNRRAVRLEFVPGLSLSGLKLASSGITEDLVCVS